jgi:hypothetical protein
MIPNNLRIIRMTTMTSRICTALPERGMPEKTFGPRNPSNHRMSRTTIMVYSIEKLLI